MVRAQSPVMWLLCRERRGRRKCGHDIRTWLPLYASTYATSQSRTCIFPYDLVVFPPPFRFSSTPFVNAAMATDSRTYLSTEIISEQRTISYRNVARALKCHVNTAKCMLYEYYEDQNKRKKGSIYATYMLAGTKKSEAKPEVNGNGQVNGHKDEEGDEQMALPSSPPPFTSSMMDPSQSQQSAVDRQIVRVKTIMLVREEHLEDLKSRFEEITSIHIYSLSPGRIPDLVALTDIGRGLYADVFSKEDPLTENNKYGVIQNKDVRRRKGNRPHITPAAQPKMMPVKEVKKEEPKKSTQSAASSKPTSTLKKEETTSRPSSRDSASTQDKAKPSLKRDASDIFKAFAKSSQKAKGKPKEEAREDSQDTKMTDVDDEGESEDEAMFLDTQTKKAGTKRTSEGKQVRAEKAAKLRKMMDSDDEAEVQPVEKEAGLAMDEPEEKNDVSKEAGEEDVAWSDSDGEGKAKKEEVKQEPVGPRRKRGKRKVMKKRTMKDEDGFLATKEEEMWEDFSETDDDEPKKVEVKKSFPSTSKNSLSSSQSQTQSSQKSKAGGKKGGGGGSIMSFFGKK